MGVLSVVHFKKIQKSLIPPILGMFMGSYIKVNDPDNAKTTLTSSSGSDINISTLHPERTRKHRPIAAYLVQSSQI